MNLPCKVIEDLLPLYHDGVCSEESRMLVETHLAVCADCKDVLHNLKEEVSPHDSPDSRNLWNSFQQVLRRLRWQSTVKGILLTAMVCILLAGAFWSLTQWSFMPMSTEELHLTGVGQLENGRICYGIRAKGRDSFGTYDWTLTEDGSLYLTPKRPLILLHPEWSGLEAEFDPDNISGYRGIPNKTVIEAFYVGTPEDGILIWQRGMELPLTHGEGGFRFTFGTEFQTS